MKLAFAVLLFLFLSCQPRPKQVSISERKIENNQLQILLDSLKVRGTVLIFDASEGKYHTNSFREAEKRVIPASTFKIPHSIIGLETGILKNENTIFKWNGEKRAFPVWEKDLALKEAFQTSCVPCYQELARKIRTERMRKYLSQLNFGQMPFNEKTIDDFWLTGKSNISALQQIDFLQRLYNGRFSIAKSTHTTLLRILKIKEKRQYTLSGKTGLGKTPNGDVGWFVGFVETNGKVYYFATRISPKDENMPQSKLISIRKEMTLLAFKKLKIIEEI